jgi:protein arginine kinase activator
VCKKNPAKIHVTQVKDNKKFTIHICQECAHEKGVAGPAINTSFSVEQLLTGFFKTQNSTAAEAGTHQTCPSCGLSYGAFKESGRLGCSLCYDTFSEPLKPLLQKIQKDVRHVGKVPRKGDAQLVLKRDITDLRLQLKEAVGQEHFELAARLRDQIRQIESELAQFENSRPNG